MNLAIGFFDGVHTGHRRILENADAALTFAEHPFSVLAPDRAPALLMTAEERIRAISEALRTPCGEVRAMRFSAALAAEPPEVFANRLRSEWPRADTVLCGPNWRFGAGGRGDPGFLRTHGFAVETVPFVEIGGAPVSSTRIRAALSSCDISGANAMLGRRYAVSGRIAAGKGLGTLIGFPTLNIVPDNPSLSRLLPLGVYAVTTPCGRAIANWGVAPTAGEAAWRTPVMEIHVISPAGRLPASGEMFGIELERFIRPERRFPSLDALRRQIADDIGRI